MGTIRFRLTLWYAALFMLAGVVLLALVYFGVQRAFPAEDPRFFDRVAEHPGMSDARAALMQRGIVEGREGTWVVPGPARPASADSGLNAVVEFVQQGRTEAREQALNTLLVQSSLALGAMGLLSIGAGWWVSGRMLRPVADITGTVRRISGERLSDHRVALQGPRDELRELADQFDAMLDRLDGSFSAQREFVANASHELRTPLAVMRAELDVTFDDPDASPEAMRTSADVLRRAIGRSESLIAALLTLERADAPRQRSERVDLAASAREVLERHAAQARDADIEVRSSLHLAEVLGDPVLLERMIENLVANAIAYNAPTPEPPEGEGEGEGEGGRGWIDVTSRQEGVDVVVRVANSTVGVDAETADALFERFRRLDDSRSRETGGHGLGLAIVRAVARHHGGDASAHPVEGGLAFEVRLPAA